MSARLHPEVLARLDSGSLLVLPTSRSASELRRRFDARQRAAKLPSWELANVQSWDQWTQSLWTDLVITGKETRLLLNPTQEKSLWAEIIRLHSLEAEARSGLGSPDTLAVLAYSGFQRAATYNATSRLRTTATTEDSRIFSEWADAFAALCKKRNCLSASRLEAALIRAAEAGTLAPPPTLDLVACTHLTPAQQSLLDTLGQAGTDILHLPLAAPIEATKLSAITLPNERDELAYATHWIRTQLETAASEEQTIRLALLVPDLADVHTHIERILRDTLAPELHAITEDLSSTPWEMAIGPPLSSLPLIADALDLVRWASGTLPITRVSALLLSPYLGETTDRDEAARFDAQTLRRTQFLQPQIDLAAMLRLPLKIVHPPWLQNLHNEIQRTGDLTRPRSYADWTELFRNLTRAANWPGDRELTAIEFAAVEAWESALDAIATLDFSGQRITLTDAVTALTQQLEATNFQPPSTGAPLQVLTPADAEACLFDAILYLRATDANLPPRPTVHPLLSWPLQRTLLMPGTDSTIDTTSAKQDLTALLANTPVALFTSAQQNEDGKLRPSPLLADLNITATSAPPNNIEASIPVALETVPDTTLLPQPPTHISGGARVLQLQAACGFRAFAEFRLHASEPESRGLALGLDPSEAGNLIHSTMEIFWQRVRSQGVLRQLPIEQRDEHLRNAITAALARKPPPHGDWETAYIELQKTRLFTLLTQWLEKELQRGPFTVMERELAQEIPIGPLTLDVRFDRIDKVEDGFVLVDYKSGRGGHPSTWHNARPDEPQLPLYAQMYEASELKGLAFGNMRLGKEMKWLGYQAEDGILPKSSVNQTVDFTYLLPEWHATLAQLATDFSNGQTSVDPNRYPQTCEHCPQRLLCRLDPSSLRDSDDPDTEEADD